MLSFAPPYEQLVRARARPRLVESTTPTPQPEPETIVRFASIDGEALGDPQMVHQEMVIEVEHPGHGPVKMLGFPVKLSKTPCAVRHPAPKHGEHTAEILAELERETHVRDQRAG